MSPSTLSKLMTALPKPLHSCGGSAPPLSPGEITMEATWRSEALVLLLDIRTCKNCNNSFTAPNPFLMVRQQNPNTSRRLTKLAKYDSTQYIAYDLPRETQQIYTSISYCTNCFHTQFPHGQLELFPPRLPPTPTKGKSDDKQIIPLELSDF